MARLKIKKGAARPVRLRLTKQEAEALCIVFAHSFPGVLSEAGVDGLSFDLLEALDYDVDAQAFHIAAGSG
jgi:hypothetical protein